MKNWFRSLLRTKPRASRTPNLGASPPFQGAVPWDAARPSIYRYLVDIYGASDRCPMSPDLPDDEILAGRSESSLRWAPGALDGAFGHHGVGTDSNDAARTFEALRGVMQDNSADSIRRFYELVEGDEALQLVDPLLEHIQASAANLPLERLRDFARWLATESPDRGAVKVAISLLGLLTPPADTDLLTTLGMHEEFTLYSTVAFGNTLQERERESAWWSLAKRVNGWGRIHLVERLARTSRADIKDWLLREGYRNSVMYEYLAYSCATGGELLSALQKETIDDALLIGAGDILEALISGGPAQDISDYADGAVVTEHYLRHVIRHKPDHLQVLLTVRQIASFINEDRDWEVYEGNGWSAEMRGSIGALIHEILADTRWLELTKRALEVEQDDRHFRVAAAAGEALGLDVWTMRYQRQKAGLSSQWYDLMRTTDPDRVDLVIALAERQLNLDGNATGRGHELGLGPSFQDHSALDFILQNLGRFPSKGWSLISAGLRSPVIRNRNMALNALGKWGRMHWPDETADKLQVALDNEPDMKVKARIVELLGSFDGT